MNQVPVNDTRFDDRLDSVEAELAEELVKHARGDGIYADTDPLEDLRDIYRFVAYQALRGEL